MENQKNKIISFLADSILSGIMLGVGGMASLSSDNRYIGAFLFSLGLFCIVHFRYGLYTGKVGYIVNNKVSYIGEVLITLLGNVFGTGIAAILLRQTRFFTSKVANMDVSISERVASTVEGKLNDSPLSIFILSIFCGMLMFTAVEANRSGRLKGNFIGALFGVVMPVMVFIICGFNHCIADMFYYFFSGCPEVSKALIYFPLAIIGNGIGGIIIPSFKKLSNAPLE
ncbi:MAG: formate/nitrite transporter family protein [Ruminococcus sp.]|nr:formate/nitrite transporter family protein [Ruminococcus sp.]